MNTDQINNLIQKLVVLASGYFISKGFGDSSLWEIIGGAVAAVATYIYSHKWNATPATATMAANPPPTASSPQSGQVQFALLLCVMVFCIFAALVIAGCAAIQPGNDPVVVNTERSQTMAAASFDLVLDTDNANRTFWEKNSPEFHSFCEWLRQRQIALLPDGTATNVQRAIAMQLNLDKVKLDYKASKGSSNAVVEALATLESAEQQAEAWLTVVTNSPAFTTPVNINPQP